MSVIDRAAFKRPHPDRSFGCRGCQGAEFPVPFSMAFQPIIDAETGGVFAYEALVRGLNGEGAGAVMAHLDDSNRYAFDQQCRIRAIELAAELGIAQTGASVSINFMPNAIYRPEVCIATTLKTARRVGFPLSNIIFEFTEDEQTHDPLHIRDIVESYRSIGFRSALDDFGAGFAGLNLLAAFQPDIIKIDMALVREIDADPVRRSIVAGIRTIAHDLGILTIAEGIETEGEALALRDLGISLLQGYWFAKPAFEALPDVTAAFERLAK